MVYVLSCEYVRRCVEDFMRQKGVDDDCAKVVEPLKLGNNQVCPACKSPVMISKKKRQVVTLKSKTKKGDVKKMSKKGTKNKKKKGTTKKWGKIGAPNSPERKAFLKSIRKKRGK